MTTLDLETNRREVLAGRMLANLEGRVPHVQVSKSLRGWVCVLAGAGWETRYRAASRYDAIQSAHCTFYWPEP